MSVLVLLHAHPDDEVFTTGGTMRLAADAGHRVVLITATDGALGEFPDGLLGDGEALVERRRIELERSAAALGAHRLVQLGYADSGMAGTPANDEPAAFANVDIEVAASRIAEVLTEEGADVFTVYDDHGNYGHPDHVAVHRVGVRAAELAGTPHVYEATMNRDVFIEMVTRAAAAAAESGAAAEVAGPPGDLSQFGTPASEITTTLDVSSVIEAKRAAMVAHASQVGDFGQFLAMEPADLRAAFGTEWFVRRDAPAGLVETVLPL
jgi:LmbE family N-acetylglucosaminyl deacetylase